MRRKSVISIAVVLILAMALWLGGHWLWQELLALHGVR